MRDLYLIYNPDDNEYSNRLNSLLVKKGFKVSSYPFDQFNEVKSLSGIVSVTDSKFIFWGITPQDILDMPAVQTWCYQRFGCQIGWKGNVCVVVARDMNLAFSDYQEFREECKNMKLDHDDVIIPPTTRAEEGVEWIKKIAGVKDSCCAYHAQYSFLVHKFANEYFDKFISSATFDVDEEVDIIKIEASEKLTLKQKILCNGIIHGAALSTAAVAFIPIPFGDVIPITAVQVSMIVALANVFDNKITKADAQIILKAAAAPLVGRTLSKAGLTFVPVAGWIANGAISGTITEILGWTVVNDFASKQSQ